MGYSGAYPEKIQKNFIYRYCMNNVHNKDLNAMFAIIGKPGKGKSTLGLKFCEDIDPTFNIDRICYSVEEMLFLLDEKSYTGEYILKPGAAILFDEIVNETGSYSRRALSKHNQTMNFAIANLRARRIITIICLPKFSQLDKDIREVGLHGVFQIITIDRAKKKGKAKFKWRDPDEMTDLMKDPFPRLKDEKNNRKLKVVAVWFGKPSKELEDAYKKKKDGYMKERVSKWLKGLVDEKGEKKAFDSKLIAEKIVKNKEKYFANGKFNYARIMLDFEIGNQKSRDIIKMAESLANNPQNI